MARNATTLTNYITTAQAGRLFHRTEMTIYLWRRDKEMPYIIIPSDQTPAIRFDLDAVLSWAADWHFKYKEEELSDLRRHNLELATAQ